MNTKTLKPFDLQAALQGEPVMLRGGSKAFVRHHETELSTKIDEILIGYHVGFGFLWSWCKDGTSSACKRGSQHDIIGMYPKTRIVNGFEVPAPEKVPPKKHTSCFHANVSNDYFHLGYDWNGDRYDLQALRRGLVFLNKKDAIANAKAMVGIDPYGED